MVTVKAVKYIMNTVSKQLDTLVYICPPPPSICVDFMFKVTGYSLLINIHEKILPSFSSCRNQLQHAAEAAYNSTMSTF